MPKARRLVRSMDEWALREDKKLEEDYLKRIYIIQRQLESTKKLTRAEKLRLYNELYSAQQAIGSIRQGIKIAMLVEMIDAIKVGETKKAVQIGERLFDLLNKRDTH